MRVIDNMEIHENYSLKGLNTFGIDVKARRVVFLHGSTPDDPSRFGREVDELLAGGLLQGEYMIIGEGSNIVFTKDYEGTVVKVGETAYQCGSDDRGRLLTVGAGMLTDEMVRISVACGCYGAENLSAIPGNIGAAVVQNIGAYGVEIKDLVDAVDAVDLHTGQRRTFTAGECAFGYRDTIFKHQPGRWLICRVRLRFAPVFRPNLAYKALADELKRRGISNPTQQQMRDVVTDIRWGKLPRPEEHGSAGSFFKNPSVSAPSFLRLKALYPDMPDAHPVGDENNPQYKLSAGWLIDRAGWKGRIMSRAGVWPKNALVLYNTGHCTGGDVVALAGAIVDDVRSKFGITLEPEAIII